jgi:hypothetical protein
MKDRMMRLVVTVPDPYGLKSSKSGKVVPLPSGAFVDVSMEGKLLKGVFIIPRTPAFVPPSANPPTPGAAPEAIK